MPADGADDRLAGVAARIVAPPVDTRLLVARAHLDGGGGAGVAGRRGGGGRAVPAARARADAAGGGRHGTRRKTRSRTAVPARLCAAACAVRRGTGAAAPDLHRAHQRRPAPSLGHRRRDAGRVHHDEGRLLRGCRGMFGGQFSDRDARLFGVRGASLFQKLDAADRLRRRGARDDDPRQRAARLWYDGRRRNLGDRGGGRY